MANRAVTLYRPLKHQSKPSRWRSKPNLRMYARSHVIKTRKARIFRKRKGRYLTWPETRLRKSRKDTIVNRTVIPARVMTTLPYSDCINLQAQQTEIFTYVEYQLCLNDIYNPDLTGQSDHSARGTNQWFSMYNNSLVHGCNFELQFMPVSVTSLTSCAANFICGYYMGPPGFAYQFHTLWDLLETEQSKWLKVHYMTRGTGATATAVTPSIGGFGSRKGSNMNGRFKGRFDLKAGFSEYGMTSYESAVTPEFPKDFTGASTVVPNQKWVLTLFACSLPQTGATSSAVLPLPNIDVLFKMNYDVEFFEAKQPGLSLKLPGDGATAGYFQGSTGLQAGTGGQQYTGTGPGNIPTNPV